ncbi:MAG TPA: translocation/assembly module TamB domain-containing protein [Kofleriaceae bacterium]|nr:translocation/assembly module TamB domain-containing protein [Kofleriaceae bacterium]
MRRIVRVAAAMVGLAIITTAVMLVALHTDWGRDHLRRELETRLDGALGGPVHIGRLDGSVLGELIAHDVELDGPDQQPIMTIATVHVELALRPLLRHVARIDRLGADDVTVTVPAGWRPPPRSETPSTSRWDLDVRDLEVTGGHVIVTAATPDRTIELIDVEASGQVRAPAGEAAASWQLAVRSTWRGLPGLAGGPASVSAEQSADGPVIAWLTATIAGAQVHAGVIGDLHTPHVVGAVIAPAIDLDSATAGRFAGRVAAMAAVDITDGNAHVDARLAGESARVTTTADVAFTNTTATLTRAHVAIAADPAALSGDRVSTEIPVSAEIDAHGALAPSASLVLSGSVDARRPRAAELAATRVHADFDLHDVPGQPGGQLEITATDVRRGLDRFGDVVIRATPAGDRRSAITVHSRPPKPGWTIDAAADLVLGEDVRIELGTHRIAGAGHTWAGRGGVVAISRDRVVARGLRTSGPSGSLAVDLASAQLAGPGAGDLELAGSAGGVDLASAAELAGIPVTWRGVIDARGAIRRHAGRWTADVTATGRRLVRDAGAPPIAASARVTLASSKLSVAAAANAVGLGRVAFAVEVVPPANLTDGAAWRRTTRAALRSVHGEVAGLDLAAVGRVAHVDLAPGHVDGEIAVTKDDARGAVHVRGIEVTVRGRRASLDGDLALVPGDHGAVVATIGATALDVTVRGGGTFTPPERLFDPMAWRQLRATAVHDASLAIADTPIETALAALAISSPVTGRFAASIELADLASGPRLAVQLHGVRGGRIVHALDATLDGASDDQGITVDLTVRDARHRLVASRARAPIDLSALAARGAAALRAAALTGCVTIDATEAPPDCRAVTPVPLGALLDVIGRDDVTGTIDASITLGGTLGAPTASGRLSAHDVRAKPSVGGPAPVMHELAVEGSSHGRTIDLVASASEGAGHTLRASARGELGPIAGGLLDQLELGIEARQFDIAPLVVLAPGPLAGAAGVIDGKLEQRGVDPERSGIHGKLRLVNARMPISPSVGTLQHAEANIAVEHDRVSVELDGRVGAGTVRVVGAASLSRADDTRADATITLHHVSLISAAQPVVDAKIQAGLHRVAGRWRAEVDVAGGSITIPTRRGADLHAVGAPRDLVFGDSSAPAPKPLPKSPPRARQPDLVAVVQFRSMHVTSNEFRGDISGSLNVSVGDRVSFDGSVNASKADVDVLGRRYVVEHAALHFDGTDDPMLDIALSYDFPDVTLYAKIGGRASKPTVALTSSSSSYTQDQLFGFFLGGAPGNTPTTGVREAASGAAAGAASTMVSAVVDRLLPLKAGELQVRYEPATATSSAAVVVGLWLSRRVYVAGRSRSDPLPVIENGEEGVLEWWLAGNWMLQSVFGNRSVGSSDLVWRHRW